MFQNHFKTALRHLKKHKSHVAINAVGLGFGISSCIIAYLLWNFDTAFDQFHTKADQLYRINTIKSSNQELYGVAPAPLADLAKQNIAGVKDAVVMDFVRTTMNQGDKTFNQRILFTSDNFLEWFDFELIKGTANLVDPGSVLLTEKMVKKFFGDENPIGQNFKIYPELARQKNLIVSGVIKDHPVNSSVVFDFITNTQNKLDANGDRYEASNWELWRDAIFIAVEKQQSPDKILPQLNQYVSAHQAALPDFKTQQFFLEPLTIMAQHSSSLRQNNFRYDMPAASIWSNVVSGILLLLAACLNFSNMTISLAGKRLKEIGVRKVMGSSRGQLMGQLLTESFMICIMGLLMGLALTNWWLEYLNRIWTVLDLQLVLADNPPVWAFLAGTVSVATLAAGAYPAFYISSFNPNKIFHGAIKFGGNNLVSKILLSVQVMIAIIAVVVSLSFYNNAVFQQEADLGFNRTGIQTVWTGDESTYEVLNNEIKQNPMVQGTAGVRHHVGDSCPRYEFDLNGAKHEAEYMEIGANYLSVMDIPVLQGRAFDQQLETDFQTAILINEKFANDYFKNQDPIGQEVTFFDTLNCKVIGVVGNFMQYNFFDPLRPLVLKFSKSNRFQYIAVRSEARNLEPVETALANAWKVHFSNKPFEHRYQDDFIANSLEISNNIKTSMMALAIITLALTITGLFALVSLSILKRMKEIAVRRVLGASIGNISFLVNRSYFFIILIGILLGSVVGGMAAFQFLNGIYSIHAGVSSVVVVVAGSITLLAVGTTIGIKIWQVMRMNPAEVLKGD